jgi:hypothetical protein
MVPDAPLGVPFRGLCVFLSGETLLYILAANGAARTFPIKKGVGLKPTVSKTTAENLYKQPWVIVARVLEIECTGKKDRYIPRLIS